MILLDIATYLASVTNKVVGANVFYESIPPTPDLVIVVREPKDGGYIHPQLECNMHNIQIVVRDRSGDSALHISNECHKALSYQDGNINNDPTGLINLTDNVLANVALQGNPRYDDIDDKGRRLYKFNAIVLTQRKY